MYVPIGEKRRTGMKFIEGVVRRVYYSAHDDYNSS